MTLLLDERASTESPAALVSFEIAGPRNAPVIVVLGGISAHKHVCANEQDRSPGWWSGVAGAGCAIDTRTHRVLSIDFADGGCAADGRPARIVTTHDQADVLAHALDVCAIGQIDAVVGASYGGMVALAFAERHAERLKQVIVIGAAHQPHPMTTALRSVQRRIVELGLETGRVHDALATARALAMVTYRSAREFAERFAVAPITAGDRHASFDVENYLAYHGDRFARTWQASRFLALSLSSDLHRVVPGNVMTPATLIAAESDLIVPREQMHTLHATLGGTSRLIDLPTIHGHDAFLTEKTAVSHILSDLIDQ